MDRKKIDDGWKDKKMDALINYKKIWKKIDG